MTVTFTHLIQARILEVLSVDGAENQENRFHHVCRQYASEDDLGKIVQELDHAFALLSPAQQQVFDRFVKDAAFSTKVVSVLASFASAGKPKEYDLYTMFNKYCTASLAEQISTLLSIDNSYQFIFEHTRLQKALALYWLLSGNYISEEPLFHQFSRFGDILLDLLNHICSSSKMYEIVMELVKDIDSHTEMIPQVKPMLLKILLRFQRLSDETLHFLTEKLLLKIGSRDIISLTRKEPNSDRVQAYLHQLFNRSLADGNPKYYHALSVLSFAFKSNGFDAAAKWAASKNQKKALLGISLLGLAGWARSNHSIILQGQALCLTTGTLENMQHLLSQDTPAYIIVANSVFDLYTYTLFDPRNLQWIDIIDTALKLAHSADNDHRKAAERILALVPITTYMDPDVLHPYEQVFDKYISEDSFDIHAAVIFKILTKLRRTEGEGPSMVRLKKLYAKAASCEGLQESDLKFIELAREEFFSFPLRTGFYYETYYPAFATLTNTLSSEDMESMVMLLNRMYRNHSTFQASALDASRIIQFLRSGVNPQKLSIILENTDFQFDPHEASSYLITWLFYLFAHYQKPQAISFYNQYANILNRPYQLALSHTPFHDVSVTIQEYNTYLNETVSRVEAIFYELICEQNNRTVAELFVNKVTSPANLPFETRRRICQLLDDSSQILEAYRLNGLSPFNTDQSDVPVPLRHDPGTPLELAKLYPDDLAIVQYALETEKAWVTPLIHYSYRGDQLLAKQLIQTQRASHYHMFLPEVRFDSEILELFKEKQHQEEEQLKRYGGTT